MVSYGFSSIIAQLHVVFVGAFIVRVPFDLCAKEWVCLLYTSDAADERSSVDLGGRRIIKKKIQVT